MSERNPSERAERPHGLDVLGLVAELSHEPLMLLPRLFVLQTVQYVDALEGRILAGPLPAPEETGT